MNPSAQQPTRERLLHAAKELFYAKGCFSVGIDEIIAAVGVTKATFYNHFRSKDELVREVLVWHDRWWQHEFRMLLRKHGGATPCGQLMAIPDVIAEVVRWDGYNGCFFINAAVQFPLAHDPVHQAAATHKQAMQEILAEIAGYAGAENPDALAEELSLVSEGAYVTSQIHPGRAITEALRSVIGGILQRHVPARPS